MSSSSSSSSSSLHIFFLPFLAPGHMIPMVDLARIIASRPSVRTTIITTAHNVPLIQPTLDRSSSSSHPIQLLTLDLPPSSTSAQNLMSLPSPDLTPEFTALIDSFQEPFRRLLDRHKPDFIVTDAFYPWTVDLGVPRILFHGSNSFSIAVAGIIGRLKIHESLSCDSDTFVVPGIPHRIEMSRSQMMRGMTHPNELMARMGRSFPLSYGMVCNSFRDLEPDYISMVSFTKTWNVGPVSLCNQETDDKAVRGGSGSFLRDDPETFLKWLDARKPCSVVYVCFGSLGRFTRAQMREIALGLAGADCEFIWVNRDSSNEDEWMPEGLGKKGLIVRGWAPQILILNHASVGGFVTHCGWNSCLEGVSAGVPMVTWPLFAEQFFNERLVVDVLGIGVSVGAKVCSMDEEKRTLVGAEEVRRAVEEVMGRGEEAARRRRRVEEVGEMARRAVEEEGSSYKEVSRMLEEMREVKERKNQGS